MGKRREEAGRQAELLLLFRIFAQNFQETTDKKREGRRDTGRVSRLKIKERNKVPKRERTSEMLRENVLLCIREKRKKKPQ